MFLASWPFPGSASPQRLNTPNMLSNISSTKDNIQVVCRVRPMNSRENAESSSRCISVIHDTCKIGEVSLFNKYIYIFMYKRD